MNFNKSIVVVMIGIVMIVACRKKETPPPVKNPPPKDSVTRVAKSVDVYVSAVGEVENGITNPAYLKNDTLILLNGGGNRNSGASGIFIKDTDVYISGTVTAINGNSVACYWKNGVINKFGDSSMITSGGAITISGNDLYIAGSVKTAASTTAVYWKNGVMTKLPYGNIRTTANAIAVNGSDVYVAGSIDSIADFNLYQTAVYWKNGQLTKLKYNATASAIAFKSNDVHIVGGYNHLPIYWKNNIEQFLPDTTATTGFIPFAGGLSAIYISGDDIFIAGDLSDGIDDDAVYWKNNVPHYAGGASGVTMAVNGSDVYLTGSDFTSSGELYYNGVRDLKFLYACSPFYYSTGIALRFHY